MHPCVFVRFKSRRISEICVSLQNGSNAPWYKWFRCLRVLFFDHCLSCRRILCGCSARDPILKALHFLVSAPSIASIEGSADLIDVTSKFKIPNLKIAVLFDIFLKDLKDPVSKFLEQYSEQLETLSCSHFPDTYFFPHLKTLDITNELPDWNNRIGKMDKIFPSLHTIALNNIDIETWKFLSSNVKTVRVVESLVNGEDPILRTISALNWIPKHIEHVHLKLLIGNRSAEKIKEFLSNLSRQKPTLQDPRVTFSLAFDTESFPLDFSNEKPIHFITKVHLSWFGECTSVLAQETLLNALAHYFPNMKKLRITFWKRKNCLSQDAIQQFRKSIPLLQTLIIRERETNQERAIR